MPIIGYNEKITMLYIYNNNSVTYGIIELYIKMFKDVHIPLSRRLQANFPI